MADAYKMDRKIEWRNRIVRYGSENPEQLLANPSNPRIHPKFQQDVMVGVMNQVGWVDDVIVNLRTDEAWGADRNVETMLDGHLRVELALRKGEKEVPVKYIDLTPEEEALMLATFDPIGALATVSADALTSVLDQLQNDDLDVQTLLDQLAADAGLGVEEQEVNEALDADARVEIADELQVKWGTATGQLWHLGHTLTCTACNKLNDYNGLITQADAPAGDADEDEAQAEGDDEEQLEGEGDDEEQQAPPVFANITAPAQIDYVCEHCGEAFTAEPQPKHKIICGNSRDPLVFTYLMQDELADLVTTDPPYGVNYSAKNKALNKIGKGNRVQADIEGDDLDAAGLMDLLSDALGNTSDYCRVGAVWYVCAPTGVRFHDFGTVLLALSIWRQSLVWVKNNHVLGNGDFQNKHEMIFYGWKPGSAHKTTPDRSQMSVWEFNKPNSSKYHPTMKPIELYDHMLQLSSLPQDIVLEPFSGSGTAILACERSGRRARAVEFAPGYVAVALERWAEATKQQPQLIATYTLEDFVPAQHKTSDEERPILSKYDVPDALWATNNEFGIPLLDINMQADAVDAPIAKWGYYGRNKRVGTYHFYTEDYKFEALWKDPSVLLNSGAINVVEPNYSTNAQMPIAIVLYNIYRKRWIARWLQSKGVRIFVDLNVNEEFANENLIGIPKGWTAFFTRSIESFGLESLERHYAQACAIADGKTPLFVVYGGGIGTRKFCLEKGWLWVPENSHVMTGRFTGGVYDATRLRDETDAGKVDDGTQTQHHIPDATL